jgi:hypothetical protein
LVDETFHLVIVANVSPKKRRITASRPEFFLKSISLGLITPRDYDARPFLHECLRDRQANPRERTRNKHYLFCHVISLFCDRALIVRPAKRCRFFLRNAVRAISRHHEIAGQANVRLPLAEP